MLSSIICWSQDERAERGRDRGGREKIRAAHSAYITERLELTSTEAEKFWPVYREYGEKRRALRQQFNEAKKRGESEKSLVDLDLEIKQKMLDLEREYSGQLQQIISAEKMLELRQAEIDFRRLVLRQIQRRTK